jgi:peptide deformylase
MALLPILRWPDARLSRAASPVQGITAGIRRLAEDMLETMYAASGRGLAAPQVGVFQRLFVMDLTWKATNPAPLFCINPEILWRSDVLAGGAEGCLSIPGPVTQITRPQAIRLRWQGLDGTVHEARLSSIAAICAQHEIDHLDGILTLDHLSPTDRTRAEAEVML